MTQAKLEPGNTSISLMGRDPNTAGKSGPKGVQEQTPSFGNTGKQADKPKTERLASPLDTGVNLRK